jgi:hypothetical protein
VNVFGASAAKFALGVSALVHPNGIAPGARGNATTETARFTLHFKPATLFCWWGCSRSAFPRCAFLGFAVDVFGASDAIVALGVPAFVHSNGIAPSARGVATTAPAARFTFQFKPTALFGSFNARVVDVGVAA